MADIITKKDLEEVLDDKLQQYQSTIVEAVDHRFQHTNKEIAELRGAIEKLTKRLIIF